MRKQSFISYGRALKRQSKIALIGAAFLIALACHTHSAAQTLTTKSGDVSSVHWLIAGPIAASGNNALFVDYCEASGGEARARGRVGEIAVRSSAGVVEWQAAGSDQNGTIDFKKRWPVNARAIAYAYTELSSSRERDIVATVGSGNNIQVRLNGEIIFESRLSRKPEPDKDTFVLRLQKGMNHLLIKVEGDPGYWSLQWMTHFPAGKVFVNEKATIIPDFRVGEQTNAWGQVELANTSGAPLSDVTVEVLGDEFVLPSCSAKTKVEAGEVQRLPFWVATKSVALQSVTKPIRLRVTSGSEEQYLEFAPLLRKKSDFFVTTYRSFVDDSVQPYSLLLPTSFDWTVTYPLIVLLHGAHVTDWGQNIISYDPKEWAIQVAVHDRGNNRYRDIGEVDLDEVLADVKRRFRIDPERMYLSGHSMGGYGTWFQATRHPDRWASISPQAGYADYSLYHPVMRESSTPPQQKFQQQLLTDWSPLTFAENLLYVPAYIVHGARDDNVSVEHSRKMAAKLGYLGYTFVYDENPEGGHWWGPRGKYYGTEVVDKPPIWTFFQKHSRRARTPKSVIYETDSLRYNEAYWVTIDELDNSNQLARIEAELVAPNTIAAHLSNITQFTLRLDDDLVKANQPVKVSINDHVVFNALLPLSARLTLRRQPGGRYVQLLDDGDLHVVPHGTAEPRISLEAQMDQAGSVVGYTPHEAEPLKKRPQLYGPVIDAFTRPFLFVIGTNGRDSRSVEMQKAARRAAEAQAREWMERANGIAQVKRDVDVTREDIASRNLILFGNATTNRLLALINDELPIRFTAAGVLVGRRVITGEDLGLVMVAPNPLNLQRYVLVVVGSTPRSFEIEARLGFTELPDYVIFDHQALTGKEVSYLDGGFFNKFWRLSDQTKISRVRTESK